MTQTSLVGLAAAVLAAGCGGSPSGGASAPSGTQPAASAALDLGPALTAVLPSAQPRDAGCLGMTRDGLGALVVSPRSERDERGEEISEVQVEFVMLEGTSEPVTLGAASLPLGDADAWTAWRAEHEPQLVALELGACEVLVEQGGVLEGTIGGRELQLVEAWTDADVDPASTSVGAEARDRRGDIILKVAGAPDAIVHTIQHAAGDGGDHQVLEAAYFSSGGRVVVLAISNADTGFTSWDFKAVDAAPR